MSKIVFKTINPVVGCRHDRVYCWCRMQARRQKRRCLKCYRFEPHTHFERLKGLRGRPKTIWFVDMGRGRVGPPDT
ncbi:hypothetical protein DRO57_03535 [Candidatus Bathyarchaeota archaeon]|nr:MAG: hypothetical protein DRO57_03535 [Candidatus Bathyarchaeota archaeon]